MIEAENIGEEITTKGWISKISEITPRIAKPVFRCQMCGEISVKSHEFMSEKVQEPRECGVCGKSKKDTEFKMVTDESDFVDYQEGVLVDDGNSIPLVFKEDKVGSTTVGEKVEVEGTLKEVPSRKEKTFESTKRKMYLDVSEVNTKHPKEEQDPKLELPDLGFSKKKLEEISSNLEEGNNVLLVFGDEEDTPYQELQDLDKKSQVTEYMDPIREEKVIGCVGREQLLGSKVWCVEGSSYVFAHQGICLIPDFHQLSKETYSPLVESLRNGTISVAKAGINLQIPADVTILATTTEIDNIPHPLKNEFEIMKKD